MGSIPELGRSLGEGNGQPTPVFLPGESHGRRNLVGYSPQGHKESDITERLHFLSFQKVAFTNLAFKLEKEKLIPCEFCFKI